MFQSRSVPFCPRLEDLEREKLLYQAALRIRGLLDLQEILEVTTAEVRQFLDCDRVLVYQFHPDMSGIIVAESVTQGWRPALGSQIQDTCFQSGSAAITYQQGRKRSIANIYTAGLTDCHLKLLEEFQVKANLVVPILVKSNEKPSPELWGLLVAHQCSDFREWYEQDLMLLDQLAVQIAIAIQQGTLYQQVQIELEKRRNAEAELRQLNEDLETRVSDRTAQLSQANQLLRAEIFERLQVQRALQESQLCLRLINGISTARTEGLSIEEVIQQTLRQIARFLPKLGVAFSVIDQQQLTTVQTVTTSELPLFPQSLNLAIARNDMSLALGEVVFTPDRTTEPMSPFCSQWMDATQTQALLAVPFQHPQEAIGVLSLHAPEPRVWTEYEIGSLMEIAAYLSLTLHEAYETRQRREAEAQLKASLKEKNILLKEVHHRVKNNLQVISSLLRLQASSVEDPTLITFLEESRSRVCSMALIHEKLYESANLANINFVDYVKTLTNELLVTYTTRSTQIHLQLDIAQAELSIDQAIPCGLILNELMTNVLKYAFPGDRPGEVKITFRQQEPQGYRLSVQDNGIGIPDQLDLTTATSLGLRLVRSLTRQLRGKVTLDRTQGTCFTIDF